MTDRPPGAERRRLADADAGKAPWRAWGPYVSERAWGTVREDYGDGSDTWGYFPYDHARSRAYRWSEDGLGAVSDASQHLCLAFAFWNGRDPHLKERLFGLSGPQGNHGEDVKEHYFYVDSTPTHSWMTWRYHYPVQGFPYADLVSVNAVRTKDEPEYELADTGVLDHGWWDITVDYAKAAPDDLLLLVTVTNASPSTETLHVLPTLWLRNTWSWGDDPTRPTLVADEHGLTATHPLLGTMRLVSSGEPVALVCDNDTNTTSLYDVAGPSHPKDAINDTVVAGAQACAADGTGTKGALHHVLTLAPGESTQIKLRLSPDAGDLGKSFDATMGDRRGEADEFYSELVPRGLDHEAASIVRQACAGMLWSKQLYHYDVARWLEGDPGQPPPPAERLHGRNSGWRHLNNHDILSMPDAWEYPWYAAWDLAFHCLPLARLDPGFAKHQLLLLCREWYMHPNGQLPAYEWAFGDVNPPVHAWAAMRVFEIDGRQDYVFLERMFHKLLLNFTWWVNRKDAEDNNVFEGGFLGMDNVGPFDRSAVPDFDGHLEQSDATAWMAMYCLDMLEMAITLAAHDPSYEDMATKFFEHFSYIASAINDQGMAGTGLWDEEDGFYYDVLRGHDGATTRLAIRSMVGLIPLAATLVIEPSLIADLPDFSQRLHWFMENKPEYAASSAHDHVDGVDRLLLSIVSPQRLPRILSRLLDEQEFLSPHGFRSMSRHHLEHPFVLDLNGVRSQVDYEPAESRSGLFGGNSNWRGPVWFPVNLLLLEALDRFGCYFGDDLTVECPTGNGSPVSLAEVRSQVSGRLVGLFRRGTDGTSPAIGDAVWRRSAPDALLFHEYFDGDTGAGLGASHQTGWTGLVAELALRGWLPA